MKTTTLEEAIEQERFSSEEEKALVNIIFTGNWVQHKLQTFFKQFEGLTHQQYNVLRILKGQNGKPLSLLEIKRRMLDPNSDTSRIIDRMVSKGMIHRSICADDRRQIELRIEPRGEALLGRIGESHLQLFESLAQLPVERLRTLNLLLDEARG